MPAFFATRHRLSQSFSLYTLLALLSLFFCLVCESKLGDELRLSIGIQLSKPMRLFVPPLAN
jgi:hypothetical protein